MKIKSLRGVTDKTLGSSDAPTSKPSFTVGFGPRRGLQVQRPPAPLGHQRHVAGRPPGHQHVGGVGVVERFEQHHLVARIDQRLHRREQRLGGPHRDQQLRGRVERAPDPRAQLERRLLEQRRRPRERGVLLIPADAVGQRLERRARRVEVGEALPQVDGAVLARELAVGGEDGLAEGGDPGGAPS